MFISETKLDQTFNDRLLTVGGYKLLRRDRNCRGGGVMALMNSEFAFSRKNDTESKDLENRGLHKWQKMASNGTQTLVSRQKNIPRYYIYSI